jgi:eukaryotic-like serine/threonine-protein kinase
LVQGPREEKNGAVIAPNFLLKTISGGGSLTVIAIGTTLNERFLLEKELGRGGMGAVYLANDVVLQRRVAIKVLKEQSGEEVGKKLRLEAQIAARLLHENVVRIYDFGQTDTAYYLVMEEVNGSSYSKRWRHIMLAERLRILAQVADALDYAHHQGVIHRDVKPGNVLLTAADVPKLSDFGLSMIAEQGDQTGVIRGTPHYMSPEQTRATQLDYRTDLYSLGVMIYESATGGVPFTGPSLSIMSQHYSAIPDAPRIRNSLISPELEGLIVTLMSKRPEDRPNSGAIVAQLLRDEIQRRVVTDRSSSALDQSLANKKTSAGTIPAERDGTTAAITSIIPTAGHVPSGSLSGSAVPQIGTESLNTEARSSSLVTPAALSTSGAISVPATVLAKTAFLAGASVAGTKGVTGLIRSMLARQMLEVVLDEPLLLTAEERFLHGHYLAYLLSGSRRRGFLMRRPLEPRNADRGRLLLGLTYALTAGATVEAIRHAAALLDQKIEVRPILSPIVVAKYLACRNTAAKRKLFRQTRKSLAHASRYAQRRMLDAKGSLNPGLMPQRLEDLNLIAPARTEVDDVLVERWNRVAEVWRNESEFRNAVLRYATRNAHRNPASAGLWPEVVYPLIERARWHRRIRSRTEAVWDYLCGHLHVPDAGIALDRALDRAVPAPLVAQLDESLNFLEQDARIEDEDADPFATAAIDDADRLTTSLAGSKVSLVELAAEPVKDNKDKGLLQLAKADPFRFSQSELHELWKEALKELQSQAQPGSATRPSSHRTVSIGPYRLVVVPSIRGRAAGQIAIQGMRSKQIELSTPTVRTKGSAAKTLVAVWVYCDNSLVIAHLDFMNTARYVLWYAPRSHQINFSDAAELNHELFGLGMEVPEQVDKVLSRNFGPRRII